MIVISEMLFGDACLCHIAIHFAALMVMNDSRNSYDGWRYLATLYMYPVYRVMLHACSAICTTLLSSMARVIGPTPPGLGV